MDKELSILFDTQFKFSVGQTLRHKGDKKEYGSNDMGLMVLCRSIHQEMNGDGFNFERTYHCRIIAFSGSGGTAQFKENELQTIEDWQLNAVHQDVERNLMRSDIERVEKDILAQFGLTKPDRFYLKEPDGSIDKSKEYRMNGFKANKDTGKYEISVRRCNTLQTGIESIYVADKGQLEIIGEKS